MKSLFKILTFILVVIALCGQAFPIAEQLDQNTHLRWKIQADQKQITISKKNNKVRIQTLDPEFFLKFSEAVTKFPRAEKYHQNLDFQQPQSLGAPYILEVSLKDSSVELFNFYKQDRKEYVLDFWVNQDVVKTKKASVSPRATPVKIAKRNLSKKKMAKKSPPKVVKRKKQESAGAFKVIDPMQVEAKRNQGFRDFRYGAAFVWDYEALIPPLRDDLNLSKKAPDYLYEVPDMKYLDDKKQAHMQLSINFYRKQEWGLMTRSIELYQKKYGNTDLYRSTNDFMKAVALIRNMIKEKLKPEYKSRVDEAGEIVSPPEFSQRGIVAAAKNILAGIVDNSKNYQMKIASLRYLIQDSRNQSDHIKALDYAKKLYVEASEKYDDDNIILSSQVILNSLAYLKQTAKIKEFLGNKVVRRVLPAQVGSAYIDYINLSQDKTQEVIKNFKRDEASYSKPIHPAIIFNVAEAYFRTAQYEKAIKYFDSFIEQYSFFTQSSHARLRLAQSFDLLDKKASVVLRLYEDAINKSTDMGIRYEAKVRYVGLRVARKIDLKQADTERVVFLEADLAEKKHLKGKLKKLLWLTRLRTYISQQKYQDALTYLSTLPIDTLQAVDQRTFLADGAEIVLGLIKQSYMNEEYAKAVKIWETYKEKYEKEVTRNPYTNFIVSDSFLKIGLLNSFNRSLKYLEELNAENTRRFPIWVTAHKNIKVEDYLVELKLNKLLKEKNYQGLLTFLDQIKAKQNVNDKFYRGIALYHLKKYPKSVSSFEDILVSPNLNNILSPRQNQLMLSAYLESLYEAAKPAKFRKNVVAISTDLRNNNKPNLNKLLMRADYLFMESLFSESKVDYKRLGTATSRFLKENKNSPYQDRVNYLRGVSLVNTESTDEGKKILKEIIDSKDAPEYLKGLAKTELSTIELKNKTL